MSRKFNIVSKYYDKDRKLYKYPTVEFDPGVTILIGCNGSGKTTLLRQIKDILDKEKVPNIMYDNYKDGNKSAKEMALYSNDFSLLATLFTASEGEQITCNLNDIAVKIGHMMRTTSGNQKWILFDAIDSGFSVDQIQEVKRDLFHFIIDYETKNGKEIYIICAVNGYEMCVGEKCFNVVDGKYVDIHSYDDYRNEVIKTREYKDKWVKKNESKRNQ